MAYKTLYEYPGDVIFDQFTILCLIFLLSAIVLFALRKKIRPTNPRKLMVLIFFLAFVPGITFFSAIYGRTSTNEKISTMLKNQSYKSVEGPIVKFDPPTTKGKERESFEIEGVYFEYWDNKIIPGYHQSSLNGGVIKDGASLRIGYYTENGKNYIIKIEQKI